LLQLHQFDVKLLKLLFIDLVLQLAIGCLGRLLGGVFGVFLFFLPISDPPHGHSAPLREAARAPSPRLRRLDARRIPDAQHSMGKTFRRFKTSRGRASRAVAETFLRRHHA
jgi:hypothetical protein